MKLTGYTILFLSLPKHDGQYTSTPWQIASELATANKVIFVDHPYTWADAITGFTKQPIRKRLKALFGNGKAMRNNNLDVLMTPFVWPINFLPKGKLYNLFSAWNHKILARRVNDYLKKNNLSSLIYVNSFNFYFPDLHKYLRTNVALNVYHCIDPMVKQFTVKHGSYLQNRAAQEADCVISTAPALQKNFVRSGILKSYLVPNGANYALFQKANTPIPVHGKLSHLKGKVLGYLGNIERRTDYQLLLKVLDHLQDWHLVLAGPVEQQYVPVEILNHKRIIFIGSIPHAEAPSVVKRFDVAIIPFKCDEVSSGIYPLKLFEYLAAGKPVVATNFNPEVLQQLKNSIHIADHDREFSNFCLLAYATDSDEFKLQRMKVAAQNTWKQRAQLFSAYIAQELMEKYRLPYVA